MTPLVAWVTLLGLFGLIAGGVSSMWVGAFSGLLIGLIHVGVRSYRGKPARRSESYAARSEQKQEPPVIPEFPYPRRNPKTQLRWVPANEPVSIGDFQISSGMIYVCDGAPEIEEASAINTRLRVGTPARGEEAQLGYYSQYSMLSPNQRGAYLEWLANGRRDVDPASRNLGYIFLFIYGLERRALLDKSTEVEPIAEVVRLVKVYGQSSRSLKGYGSQLVHYWAYNQGADYYLNFLEWLRTENFPVFGKDEIALALAAFQQANKGLPGEFAYDIARLHLGFKSSVVVRRASDQMRALFVKRYKDAFPGGLALRGRFTTSISYRPASPSLLYAINRESHGLRTTIPDVLSDDEQFSGLERIWDSCITALSGYSRQKGQKTNVSEFKAYLALPYELRQQSPNPLQANWNSLLDGVELQNDCRLVQVGDVAELIEVPKREKLTITQSRQLADAIESLGFAVQPDARCEGSPYEWEQQVAVFQPKGGKVVTPSSTCLGAEMLLNLCFQVAGVDGEIVGEEIEVGRKLVEGLAELTPEDRERLDAMQITLLASPESARYSVAKVAKHLSKENLAKVGNILVDIAAADSLITKEEIRALAKIFKAFELPAERLDQLIAETQRRTEEICVQRAGNRVAGEPVPPKTGFVLDMARVQAISAETKDVIVLLSEVMTELDEEEQPAPSAKALQTPPEPMHPKAASATEPIPEWMTDLATKYQPALVLLVRKDSWTRIEFNEVAKAHRLMPLDLHDAVNEWADEALGGFLLEGEEPIKVNRELITSI